jgi:hypothetical protein
MAPWMSRAHVCPTPLETSATCIPSGTMTGFALDSTGVSPCYRSCFFDVILDNGAADQYLNLFQHFRRPMEVPVPQCISRHPREPCYFATGSIGHALRGSAELPGFLRFSASGSSTPKRRGPALDIRPVEAIALGGCGEFPSRSA